VGGGLADDRGEDPEPDALVDVVIELVDGVLGHGRS
jgi:hypothetical protein